MGKNDKDDKKGNSVTTSVKDFFSAMGNDIAIGIGMKDDPGRNSSGAVIGPFSETSYEKRTRITVENEKKRNAASGEGNGQQQRRPQAKHVPIKTVEDYYNLLKGPVEPLPSLLTPTSKTYSKPKYGDVSTRSSTKKKGEGVEARSFFQSMSTGYV